MSGRSALVAILIVALAAPCLVAAPASDKGLAEVTKRLASAKVTVELDKGDPDKALDIIRDAAKINIVVDPPVRKQWETQTVTLKLKDISALSAFYHILHNLNLSASFANEAFIVNLPDKYQPNPQVTVFDIRDITEASRSFRVHPTVFGAQIDPLWYWYRGQLGAVSGSSTSRDPFAELENLDRYPPDHIGEVIAETVGRAVSAKNPDVSISYYDGYLVVTEQPKAARLPITPEEQDKAAGTTGK